MRAKRAAERAQPIAPRAGVHNADVAAAFEEIADLLEIGDESPFRVRAYRNAARVVRDLGREVGEMVAGGEDLTTLPGIGADLAAKIRELAATGELGLLASLRARTPSALTALLALPGLGPKRVRALYDALGVTTEDELGEAARAGKIRALPGFGEKTEARILSALAARAPDRGRKRIADVTGWATSLERWLLAIPGVTRAIVAGSYRRGKETVGDLDVIATAEDGAEVLRRFTEHEGVANVIERGPTRATVELTSGLHADVRVVPAEAYGAALHYFTGSKAHNIAIRRLGQERGLKINEYGVFRGDERVAGETEESVFASVGLPWIPPELREERGEIEAAREGRLPDLVRLEDLRGDLHAHTTESDGSASLRQMAEAARARGLSYLAITDHSPRVRVTRGLGPDRLLAQIDAIARLNEELSGITLLAGIEVDILPDGRLDLPDDILARLDVVVGAVHSHFDLPEEQQTRRVLRAMDRPHFSILAHPTTRIVLGRAACKIDMERVMVHAKERGIFVEIDAQPERLDLPDVYARMARDAGVLAAVSSDAHDVLDFGNLRFGVLQARRGWMSRDDVLNTRSLGELRTLLRRGREGRRE
jgi:DNA polymerase (family 10)